MGGLDSKSQVLLYTIGGIVVWFGLWQLGNLWTKNLDKITQSIIYIIVSMIGLFMIYRFYDLGVSPALV